MTCCGCASISKRNNRFTTRPAKPATSCAAHSASCCARPRTRRNTPVSSSRKPRAMGPSGLADRPRPFIIRAAHLDGQTITASSVSLRCTPLRPGASEQPPSFGGSGRESAPAAGFWFRWSRRKHRDPTEPPPGYAAHINVKFVAPTELKGADRGPRIPHPLRPPPRPHLHAARALRARPPRYRFSRHGGSRRAGPYLALRPEVVRHRTPLQPHRPDTSDRRLRRSAEYDGDLGEFLPYLRAGQWTGVGRQTVWGKGEICFQHCS